MHFEYHILKAGSFSQTFTLMPQHGQCFGIEHDKTL